MFIYWASRIVIGALVVCLAIFLPFIYSGTELGEYRLFGLVLLPLVVLSPFAIIGVLVSTPSTTSAIRILKKIIWIALALAVLPLVLGMFFVLLFPEFAALGLLMTPITLFGLPMILIGTVGVIIAELLAPKS